MMDYVRPVILDLCGGTGAWSRPYKEAGYDVKVCTLPQVDVTTVYFKDDNLIYWSFSENAVVQVVVPIKDIIGILAAPPCTEFSLAKNTRPRDFEKGMEIIEACMRIIWEVRKRTKLQFWALENPRGLLRQFLGIPNYTFEQWQFGGSKVKATDIWGYFNMPTSTVKNRPANITVKHPCGNYNSRAWGKLEVPDEYADYINQFTGYAAKRAAVRAITPAGFAEAFYKANKSKGEIT